MEAPAPCARWSTYRLVKPWSVCHNTFALRYILIFPPILPTAQPRAAPTAHFRERMCGNSSFMLTLCQTVEMLERALVALVGRAVRDLIVHRHHGVRESTSDPAHSLES